MSLDDRDQPPHRNLDGSQGPQVEGVVAACLVDDLDQGRDLVVPTVSLRDALVLAPLLKPHLRRPAVLQKVLAHVDGAAGPRHREVGIVLMRRFSNN